MPARARLLLVLLPAAFVAACAPAPTPTGLPPATIAPTLIPADSDSPAAGICGTMDGDWVTFTVFLDVPSPRCIQVHPGQRMEIANPTAGPIVVTFAGREMAIEAGASQRIDSPFGSFLAPGVHSLYVTQGSGNLPEFWLLPE
jgi:hypothetical protein